MQSEARVATNADAGRIEASIDVGLARTTVWHELVDPVAIEQWWGHPAVFPDGFTAGSEGTFAWRGETFPVAIDDFAPERLWQFRWGDLGQSRVTSESSTVRFELFDSPTGTTVTVVETFPSGVIAEENVEGWLIVLNSFAAYLAQEA